MRRCQYGSNIFKSSRGTSIVFFSIALALIALCAAITVDVGLGVLEKSMLSASVDAAALAGAQELLANPDNTRNIVEKYILKNSGALNQVDINIDQANKVVEVSVHKTIANYFAGIIGKHAQDISACARARVENIMSLEGVRPLAVIHQDFKYGQLYTLKEDSGDGIGGNYAAIALGGTGTSIYRNNLLYGFDGTISVGDMIQTETGVIAQATEKSIKTLLSSCTHDPPCTYTYYNKNCSRIIFISIVETLNVEGRKFVRVLGFGTFFLEDVLNKAGQAEITGRFITYQANGETSSEINDYGTYGIRLVK